MRLARKLRHWSDRLDPTYRPSPTVVGHAVRDIKVGELVKEGDILTQGAIVARQPLDQIKVVPSSIGVQASRTRKRNEKTAWKNRR